MKRDSEKRVFMENTQYVGKSVERLDLMSKVSGRALYTADYKFENLLEVSLVRSKVAHGILEATEVPDLPDGCFCFTSKDIVENVIPSIFNEQPVLVSDHIRYFGEPVAIVAAPSKELADKIASDVKVSVKKLPVVDDLKKALEKNSPKLFEKGNLCTEFHTVKGDVEQGFRDSFLIVEDSFETQTQLHGFIETESAVSYIDDKGRLAIISSTQNPYLDLKSASLATGRSTDKITSRAATVGGAFGGKDLTTAQVFAAVVTHCTGLPARYVYTREENIRYGFRRHKSESHAKIGFTKDGKILAAECYMDLDTGAYALYGPSVMGLGMEHFTGCYNIDNVKLDGHLVYTNRTPASAMRGFGAPQAAMAFENLINRAAKQLGISQLQIRKLNAIHTGQKGPMGGEFEHSIALEEALNKFEKSKYYKEMTENPENGCGYSLAVGMMSSGLGKHVPDNCYLDIKKSKDKYEVYLSLVDLGQGSQTVLSQIAADALGVPMSDVKVFMADSSTSADSSSTAASRSTYLAGNAIVRAAEEIKKGNSEAHVVYAFPEASGEAVHTHFAFIVQGAKVKVNSSTGKVDVLWIHNTVDTGNVINPILLDGQVFGGVAMSVGMALSEEVRYKDAVPKERSLAQYILPTSLDVPRLTNEFVINEEPTGPFGAKGMAELPTVAVAPAIVSAVESLYPNIKINRLPIDRQTILNAGRGL